MSSADIILLISDGVVFWIGFGPLSIKVKLLAGFPVGHSALGPLPTNKQLLIILVNSFVVYVIYAKNNKLTNFSEQQLIDCSIFYGNLGCNGGLMDNAFEYATDHYMCSEENIPYEAKSDMTFSECFNCKSIVQLKGCADVPSNNQTALKIAVSRQPVSVAIEADTIIFDTYKSGIISSSSCGTNLDHGVLIIGYGSENGKDYWLLKNSWGESWGENGYFRIKRDDKEEGPGICGIASTASYPVL